MPNLLLTIDFTPITYLLSSTLRPYSFSLQNYFRHKYVIYLGPIYLFHKYVLHVRPGQDWVYRGQNGCRDEVEGGDQERAKKQSRLMGVLISVVRVTEEE